MCNLHGLQTYIRSEVYSLHSTVSIGNRYINLTLILGLQHQCNLCHDEHRSTGLKLAPYIMGGGHATGALTSIGLLVSAT